MKVLLVSGKFDVPVVEGTQKSMMNLANQLAENGNDVTWLTKGFEERPHNLSEDVRLVGRSMNFKHALKHRNFTKDFDIVNVHTSSPKMAFYWYLVSAQQLLVTWSAHKNWSKIESVVQQLTHNTAVTPAVANRLPGVPEITPYSVDTGKYCSTRRAGSGDVLKVLFIGKPKSKRGFDHVCEILNKLDCDFEFNYALAPTRGGIKKAERKLEAHGLQKKTNIKHGFVENLPEYINENDVFINLIENSSSITSPPILTLESMACELTTICSKIPEFEELIEDGENGFIFQYNEYDRAVEILEELDSKREKIPELGEEARKTILEKHDKQKSAQKFEQAYQQIAGR